MRVEALLVETEALNLVEIDAARLRRDVERRVRDDRLVAEILGREEYKLLFAEVNGHRALFRFEPPRQARRDVAVERNRHSLIGGDGRVGICALRCPPVSGRAAECAIQFWRIGYQPEHDAEHDEARQKNIPIFPVARLHLHSSGWPPPVPAVM
jgi:hypothetical protein